MFKYNTLYINKILFEIYLFNRLVQGANELKHSQEAETPEYID